MKMQWSIRVWLLCLGLVMGLPFLGLLASDAYEHMRDGIQQVRETTRTHAHIAADETWWRLHQSEDVLAAMALQLTLQPPEQQHCATIVAGVHIVIPSVSDTLAADRQPQEFCTATPNRTPASFLEHYDWQAVQRENRFAVLEPFRDPANNAWMSVLAYPLRDKAGQPIGLIALPIDTARYQLSAATADLPPDSVATLVSSQGAIVARWPQPERWVGTTVRDAVAQILAQPDGMLQRRGVDGVERIYSVAKVGSSGWHVWVGIPTMHIYAASQTQTLRTLAVGLLSLALAIWLATLIGRRIVVPVHALAFAASEAAAGRPNARVPVSGPTEIARIACRFNMLLDARTTAVHELRQLEQRFTTAFHASPLAITISTLDEGRYVDVNDRFLELIGYTRDETIGRTSFDLGLWIDVNDRQHLLHALQGPASERQRDLRMRVRSGDIREMRVSVERIDVDGATCLLAMLQDITDRKRAQKRLHAQERAHASLLRNLNGMAYRCRNDEAWTMELVSEGCFKLTGYR
ncbi:MAG TPA: PAS domain S-box protein, partial [Roseiflexaceae bacterium]|nr:PAS domain S-box protein [Roseiflexaceae bacterium]